ncbi:hypothetical protein SeMB42_g02922 [Synchytrium endobioticum]|uniref:Uncharacterized protein n=1 Tax=Synchytrium endobioticum TaxID=286115 RepID=A0A507DAL8_9FUNG|nr:hypothetical protein SeLEV6574_g03360 [Synchytrium endobioticum]TPX48613.1 hypothetical protein SeMB42_g02922 [Synchytrium endobioticum]
MNTRKAAPPRSKQHTNDICFPPVAYGAVSRVIVSLQNLTTKSAIWEVSGVFANRQREGHPRAARLPLPVSLLGAFHDCRAASSFRACVAAAASQTTSRASMPPRSSVRSSTCILRISATATGRQSALCVDDQCAIWRRNERLRQDLDAKSKLADEMAQRLRAAQPHLATIEHESTKYKRALQHRKAVIRRAAKILNVHSDMNKCNCNRAFNCHRDRVYVIGSSN